MAAGIAVRRDGRPPLINYGYKTFELFYGNGGHGGPYRSVFAAVRMAIRMLRGSRTEETIVVHDRKVCDPRLSKCVAVCKGSDGESIIITDVRI